MLFHDLENIYFYLFLYNLLCTKEKLVKPEPKVIYPDIDSLCAKVEKSHVKHFDSVLMLSSLGAKYKKITIPFNQHKHSRKLEANGKLLSGIQISREKIYLRWEMNVLVLKEEGAIVGCDTGINAVVTLSDKQQSKPCNHGHTLNTILKKTSRKTKDADYNASCNHEKTLPSATFLLFRVDKPKKFFWKEEGFFDLHGLELAVPITKK